LRVSQPEGEDAPDGSLLYGDRVRIWADCERPGNFENPGSADRVGLLARRGIFLLARVKSPRLMETMPRDFGNPWTDLVVSVRRSIQERIRRVGQEGKPREAAILSSILLGDYAGLSTEIRTQFQNAGTYHVLVVSGLHISTIAWIILRMFRLLRMPVPAARLLAASGVLFFTSLAGFQASITRALWMFTMFMAGQSLFRRSAPENTLLACAFLLLSAHPAWLWDTGFQLSFLSVAAIVLMGMPILEQGLRPLLDPLRHAGDGERLWLQTGRWHAMGRRWRFRWDMFAEGCADATHPRLMRPLLTLGRFAGRIGFAAGSMLVISFSVQLWLEPLLAYNFNRLSWVAPAANLIVVPASSLVLLAGTAATLITGLFPAAWFAFRLSASLAWLLLEINGWFAAWPGAWQRCPTPPASWVVIGFLGLFTWSFLRLRRLWIPSVCVGIEIAILSLTGLQVFPGHGRAPHAERLRPESRLRIVFLDVGQGDAVILRFPDGRVWAMDAGGLRTDITRPDVSEGLDIGEAVVSRFLWSEWTVALDRIILTHPHADHAGGIPALLRNFPCPGFLYGDAGAAQIQDFILGIARGAGAIPTTVTREQVEEIAGVRVRIMRPRSDSPARILNNNSLVMHIRYGNFTALLPGDLEETGESGMRLEERDWSSRLLKVPHHGSRTATSNHFLDHVLPRWAVISAGRRNPFQNPSRETLQRLLTHGARVLQTMDQGAIFFETDGVRYQLRSHRRGVLEEGILD
jgi:competence protein ComEC